MLLALKQSRPELHTVNGNTQVAQCLTLCVNVQADIAGGAAGAEAGRTLSCESSEGILRWALR